jgi:hypothetical protein
MVNHLCKISFHELPIGWYFWRKEHPLLWFKYDSRTAINMRFSANEDPVGIPGQEDVLAYDYEAVSQEEYPIIINWTGNPDPDF